MINVTYADGMKQNLRKLFNKTAWPETMLVH